MTSKTADCFGTCAAKLAGLAAQTLSWPPETFWTATPADLAAVLVPIENCMAGLSRHELNTMLESDKDG